jgi:hypothetical protein
MAQGKGGFYGGFVQVEMPGGTSKYYGEKKLAKYAAKAANKASATEAVSVKCNIAFVKEPIAKFFGLSVAVPMDIVRASLQDVKTTIEGKEVTRKTMVNEGATGASRAVTIKFAKLQKIGGKDVSKSVRMAMPSSHTFGDMVQMLMTRTNNSVIAAIVSPSGRTMTFQSAYNKKAKKVNLKGS